MTVERDNAGGAAADVVDHSNAATSAGWMRRFALADIRLARGRTGRDDPFFLELPRHRDDLLLRLFHVADAHRAHDFHLFLEHLGSALRHVAVEPPADLLAGPLERHGERL